MKQDKIFLLSTETVPPLSEIGGKAKALIKAKIADFPVPEGMVLGISFFKPWIEELKLMDAWNSMVLNVTKENCDRFKKTVEGFSFTKEQRVEFTEILTKITASVFAVRSSSSEEDLTNISFAGMYDSYLGISSENLENFIIKVFASMFDFRVLKYKKKLGRNIIDSKMAVIVQKQVFSDISGIGFSINPQNNCYDEVVINASFGLGEYIVSGIVTPDRYIVDTVSKEIIDRKVQDKKLALYYTSTGEKVNCECNNSKSQALANAQIFEVASLIKRCEFYYGVPIDTEWAYEKGKLYLLQARSITGFFPLYEEYKTAPGQIKNLYLDINKVTQGFDWSMSELGGDIFTKLIDVAKQGIMPSGKDGIVYSVHGRVYLIVNNMCKAFGKKMLMKTVGSYDTSIRSILKDFSFEDYMPGRKPEKTKGALTNLLKFGLKSIIPIMKARKDINVAVKKYRSCVEKAVIDLNKLEDSDLIFSSQVDFAIEIFNRLMIAFMPFTLSLMAEGSLKKLFKGKGVDEDIAALNMDLNGNPTSDMAYMQLELASTPEFISCRDANDFIEKVHNYEFSDAFMNLYQDYIKMFGCRCIGEIDIASVRPYEDLSAFYRTLRQINIRDNALQTVKRKKSEAYNRLLERARLMRKEKRFLKFAERLQWMGLREHPKYMFVYAVDVLRQNALKFADYLVKDNRLENREDIFMVNIEQVSNAQMDKKYNLIPLVAANKDARELTAKVQDWPSLIDSRGKIYTAKRKSESGDLLGDPVSPGIVKGKAKIMNSPFEKTLNKGEILVAKVTEPTWTPMFINAAAVVMEVGGSLQHGAIIAREYGIPCVTGINSITQIIKDGDIIEVDGTNGIVRLYVNPLPD